MTQQFSLAAIEQHIDAAKRESTGRGTQPRRRARAHPVAHGDRARRRPSNDAHNNPGGATLDVLAGRVRLSAGDLSGDGITGDMIIIPDRRHALHPLTDTAVLLTVAQSVTSRRTTNPTNAREERT
jgi:hypothetical protein